LINVQYGFLSELGTDLWTSPRGLNATGNFRELLAYNGLTTGYGNVFTVWNLAWGSIGNCNKTILLASVLEDGTAGDINVLVAEARFLRAYYYSVLVAQFGRVPLILDTETTLTPQRSEIPDIYAQIVSDLQFAFDNLKETPYDNNPQRVTKRAALGILARVYAQGAGEGLSEDGKTYWVRAKEVAESLINGQAAYNAALYDDFARVFAAANNRNNAEALFTAYGANPHDPSFSFRNSNNPNIYLHFYPKFDDAFGIADVFKKAVNPNTSNAYYGRLNQQFIAPTKYLVDCFDARYDKRWENTFVTAFTNYSGEQAIESGITSALPAAFVTYPDATVELTPDIIAKYALDPSHTGKKIYPYADVNAINTSYGGGYQFSPKIWRQGATSGSTADLIEVANANVHPYPLAADENRFIAYLSKEDLTAEQKKERAYIAVNLNDLFNLTADPTGSTYKEVITTNGLVPNSLANLFPAMLKFNHNFDGGWVSNNFQMKVGNIMVMRMAEIYLIAAEATLESGGSGAAAAEYLNVLRKRAVRNSADFNTSTGMQLTTATMDDVFDEYARELCGEFNRWELLKRHRALGERLQKYNGAAYRNFDPDKHYNRPIPSAFLNQINNAEEFGTNGY
jgi:hypothetical protein